MARKHTRRHRRRTLKHGGNGNSTVNIAKFRCMWNGNIVSVEWNKDQVIFKNTSGDTLATMLDTMTVRESLGRLFAKEQAQRVQITNLNYLDSDTNMPTEKNIPNFERTSWREYGLDKLVLTFDLTIGPHTQSGGRRRRRSTRRSRKQTRRNNTFIDPHAFNIIY
jgi:hypothetical protein